MKIKLLFFLCVLSFSGCFYSPKLIALQRITKAVQKELTYASCVDISKEIQKRAKEEAGVNLSLGHFTKSHVVLLYKENGTEYVIDSTNVITTYPMSVEEVEKTTYWKLLRIKVGEGGEQ